MKRKGIFLLLSVVLIISAGFTINNYTKNNTMLFEKVKNYFDDDDYNKLWKKVEKHESDGLPESALKVVEKIHQKALAENNHDQLIKALIHRLKYKNRIEEDGFENQLYALEDEIEKAETPNKQVLQSMLAEMYWWYYEANQWQFLGRSSTVDFDNRDIKTWDLKNLADKVLSLYMASLKDKERTQLLKTRDYYDEILEKEKKEPNIYPTIYDFLVHRALRFMKNQHFSVTRPAEHFSVNKEVFLKPADEFVAINLSTNDTLSTLYYATKILQDFVKFRLESNNNDAFVAAELIRIEFMHSKSNSQVKDSLYLEFLNNIARQYEGKTSKAGEALYKTANYYYNKSDLYNPIQPNTAQYKTYRRKAYSICNDVIEKYPDSFAEKAAIRLQKVIENKKLSFVTDNFVTQGLKSVGSVTYRNVEKLYLRVASISKKDADKIYDKHYNGKYKSERDFNYYNDLLKESEQIYTKSFDLPDDKDYNQHRVEVPVNELDFGYYMIVVADNDKFKYKDGHTSYVFVQSTRMSILRRKLKDGNVTVYVLDRETGKPIKNVKVTARYTKYDYKLRKYVKRKYGTYQSDKNGYFEIETAKDESLNLYLDLEKDDDFLSTESSLYLYKYDYEKYIETRNTIFTDRAIYRPGQKVFFKGISIKTDGENTKINSKTNVSVILYDVNRQKIADLSLETNEYGTFSGSFVLPSTGLTGRFQINTGYGSKYILIEEYKRPKFEAQMLPFEGNYKLNDTVEVKGVAKAYSGAKISDAKVKYRIVRKPLWSGWWWWDVKTGEVEIANGMITTDDKGEFTIKFKAYPDESKAVDPNLAFNYSISVDVTDLNGETQSTGSNITVGYVSLRVNAGINKLTDKSKPEIVTDGGLKVNINTKNLNGEFVEAKGNIKIFRLKDNNDYVIERSWQQPDKHLYTKEEWHKMLPHTEYKNESDIRALEKEKMVAEFDFDTGKEKSILLNEIKNWNLGRYVVEIESADAFGAKIKNKEFFTLYDSKSKKIPYNTASWFVPLKTNGEPGDIIRFLIGSSAKARILYDIEHKKNIITQKVLKTDNEQLLIELPIEEKYRGGVAVHFSHILHQQPFINAQNISVPYSNKMLDVEFATFRNKMLPGDSTEWRITIKDKKGEAAMAEMLATLYDASLDQFRANSWDFSYLPYYYAQRSMTSDGFGTQNAEELSDLWKYSALNFKQHFDKLNWFGVNYYDALYYQIAGEGEYSIARSTSKRKKSKELKNMNAVAVEEEAADMEIDDNGDAPPPPPAIKADTTSVETPEEVDLSNVKTRTNFNETAFFYPHLMTDKEGNIVISFTIPESLTKWKMMGFAHTKDLKYGFVQNELVTQKDLMVVPNPPRFFRESDEIEFPVKISNISEQDLNGVVQLELFDAITMKPLNQMKLKNPLEFQVKAGLNTMVSWRFKIPEGVGAITYKVVAKAGNFSDGEEQPIPVLTNRMLVTESMPLPVKGKTTKTFEFKKLVNNKSTTLRHHKYTLEFTSNPAWYAVQALPYLMEYPYECTEQTFSRYYANSLASHVANSSPKIKAVFDSWRNTPSSTALLSNLEKNEELKSLILEETPWVLNAANENERKRNIALLFDLNRMSNELQTALKKLQKAQVSNGGWPWFPGMPESRYITQHIVCGMGHLDKLGVKNIKTDTQTWRMILKAIDYIDIRLAEEYKNLKKHVKPKDMDKNHLSYTALHYLYTRSFFTDIAIPKRTQEAFDYYKKQTEEYWLQQGLYGQGMAAIGLHRFGNTTVPQKIVKSLKENSLTNEELGMYWKQNRSGWFWYQAPIETQALMIEVFTEVADDTESVNELKVWLLKQKQTQDWKTTKATVEAVYALLLQGDNWLENDELCEITVGNIKVDPKNMPDLKVEAGTGYFKTSWSGSEIKPEMGKVTVTKNDNGVSWGAVYWQYFENLDKITPHETPLKLNKKLFRENQTPSGNVIEPINTNTKLLVGDKIIVRIELRVDRDMEYVHMKDMRASGFEPINVISRYKYQGGIGYYESTRDAATNFFIGYLSKGTYVFEYPLRVSHKGNFSNGITTIQCMYAPEFTSHSEGIRVKVD